MPKLTPPVTVSVLKALKPGEEVADGGCPGLRARHRGGRVVWSVMVTDARQAKKRVELGPWPEIGVPEARARAAHAKSFSKAPAQVKETALPLLNEVITLYGELGDPPAKTWPDIQRRTRLVFRELLDQPVTGSERLQQVADRYPSRGQASVAVRYLKPILNWAGKRGYAPKGLGLELEQPVRVKRRERVLSDDELSRVLPALGRTGHDAVARTLLLTACRLEEVCGMVPAELKDGLWTIPGARRKNGKELIVPLSSPTIELIAEQSPGALVFRGERGARVQNWDDWQKRTFDRTKTEGWHRHDLRRTAATLMGREGVPHAIVEVVLGHTDPHTKLAGTYNKWRYPKEHKEALDLLAEALRKYE